MPRISIEERVPLFANETDLFEIVTKTYELPEKVYVAGYVLDYDSYHGIYIGYTDKGNEISFTPQEFIEYKLSGNAKTIKYPETMREL